MTKTTNYSITRRLITGTALLLISGFLLLTLGVWQYAKTTADISYDRLLIGSAYAILERANSRDGSVEVDIPYAALEILSMAQDDKVFYQVNGPEGQYLTGYESFPTNRNLQPSTTPVYYDAKFLDETVRVVTVSKRLEESDLSGWIEVTVAQSKVARTQLMNEIVFGELAVLVAVVLVTLASLAFGIRRTFGPLRKLSTVFKERSIYDLSPLPRNEILEIQPLIKSIDSYRLRLQANIDMMQIFIADASHQIRTALTTLTAQLEIAKIEQDPEKISARLHGIENQHRRLVRLTNQLLTHALVTHRGNTQRDHRISLDTILQKVLVNMVRDYAHTNIEFDYTNMHRDLFVGVDPISLTEAITNLIDNAIKYGPPSNHITLSIEKTDSTASVSVTDEGPGIPIEEMERVTQRFERHGSSQDPHGSGLGLSIARTVAESQGGKLELSNLAAGGLKVSLILPLGK